MTKKFHVTDSRFGYVWDITVIQTPLTGSWFYVIDQVNQRETAVHFPYEGRRDFRSFETPDDAVEAARTRISSKLMSAVLIRPFTLDLGLEVPMPGVLQPAASGAS